MTKSATESPSCQLLDLVIDLNWELVVDHARRHPQDAKFQDGDGLETPLYLACQYSAPSYVIAELLKAYPSAVNVRSNRRDLPIHIACQFGSSMEVIETILFSHPATALAETKWGKSPLMTLFDGTRNSSEQVDKEELWRKSKVLLTAVAIALDLFLGQEPLLLHAAIALGSRGCPQNALDMVIERYPEHAKQMDRSGRLPLHLAVRQTEWSVQLRRKYKPRERYSIVALLQLNPGAAHVKWRGRYPLQIAVSNGHTWHNGVDELFRAFPSAVVEIDRTTSLLPFQSAAIPVGAAKPSLDTIYHLLLAEPHVLQSCSGLTASQGSSSPHTNSRWTFSLVTIASSSVVAVCLVGILSKFLVP
jgi:hypothetical protein